MWSRARRTNSASLLTLPFPSHVVPFATAHHIPIVMDSLLTLVFIQTVHRLDLILEVFRKLRNKLKIGDWEQVEVHYKELNVAWEKCAAIEDPTGSLKRGYLKSVSILDDAVNQGWKEKKDMSKLRAKSLTSLKQTIKRYLRDNVRHSTVLLLPTYFPSMTIAVCISLLACLLVCLPPWPRAFSLSLSLSPSHTHACTHAMATMQDLEEPLAKYREKPDPVDDGKDDGAESDTKDGSGSGSEDDEEPEKPAKAKKPAQTADAADKGKDAVAAGSDGEEHDSDWPTESESESEASADVRPISASLALFHSISLSLVSLYVFFRVGSVSLALSTSYPHPCAPPVHRSALGSGTQPSTSSRRRTTRRRARSVLASAAWFVAPSRVPSPPAHARITSGPA